MIKGIAAILCIILMSSLVFAHPETLVLAGGTIIDVANFGKSTHDIQDAVIVIQGEKIVVVGNRKTVTIPRDAQAIDVTNRYVLPGLIDGYGALDNQAFANAYLYMGVTSIVGCYGYRRNPLFPDADPCPNIYLYGDVGHFDITTEDMLKQIEEHAKNGVKFLNVMYALRPEQVKLAVKKAHELGMPAIGEFAKLSYGEALELGIDAILHFGRYTIELAPPDMRKRIIEQPHGPAFREFRSWLTDVDPEADFVREFAKVLGSRSAALIPTLAIPGVDAPFFDNVWKEPVASILNPEDIQNPLNTSTGKHNFNSQQMEIVSKFINNTLKIEEQFYKAGVKYLAGSGNDINGTLPGISLHQELELLTRVGLSEREVIAAATSNFSEIFKWKEVGQIKPGCRADILVVDKNPLENIKNLKEISLVMLEGQVLDRDNLLNLDKQN
ncbi:MAG: amidohydrolase family protein [Gemmatimonadota bacterium]|nr:MAG: amidohydrolase family protein [Gemmatimonadota bacterium]